MRLATRSAVRIALLALAIAFLAYASVRVVHHQRARPLGFHDLNQYGDGDWGVYYRAGLAMRLRRPLYTLEHGPLLTFKNPPAVALLIAPLSLLPVGLARWIWFMGDLALLALLYRLAARVVFDREDPPMLRAVLIAGAIFLSLHYILDELFAGTTALLYLGMTVGSFVWAKEDKPIRAGAALALAVCLKVVPLAFLPWLVLCRRPGRSLASFAITLAILSLLPALWLGPARNFELLRQWPQHLANTEVHVQELRPTNQSLSAMLTRLLTPSVPGIHPANVASISPRVAHALWLAMTCSLGAALYGWVLLQRRGHRLDAAAVLALLLLYMTLCNPLAWRYTYVATGIPILYCLHALAHRPKATRLILALVVISYFLHFAPELLQAYSARFWGAVALAGAVILSQREKGSPVRDASELQIVPASEEISSTEPLP